MGLFAPIRDYVETLIHPLARCDALTAARHRAFIAPRLIGSVLALTAVPLYLLVRGAPSLPELVVMAWFGACLATAYYLSRTGRLESAQVLSALALAGAVTVLAAVTGGIFSFSAVWLAVVPLEPVLSAKRRTIAAAVVITVAAIALLSFLGAAHLLPRPQTNASGVLAALGILSAGIYIAGIGSIAAANVRQSARLLHREADRYRVLAGAIAEVMTQHRADGAVLFASPTAEAMFGVPAVQLHGQGLFERVHVADRPAYLTALGDAAAFAESRSALFRVRRDGGEAQAGAEFIWVEMQCRGVVDEDRQGVVAVLRDVSDRQRQQQELRDAHAAAERVSDAKTRFLATMGHELRTPLNAIIGFSDMLMKNDAPALDDARRDEYAALINGAGRHLLAVVNGMLDMSKIEAGSLSITPEPFAPKDAVDSCLDLLSMAARTAGVRLLRRVPDNLPEVVADRRAVDQILLNLVSNAIRFTDPAGTIKMGVRAEAGRVAFTVEDDGVGIRPEDLPHLGEPYFQGDRRSARRSGGSGLGLSIVKGLVDLHGGELSIRSRLGEGTQVTVRLPLDCETQRGTKAVRRSTSMPGDSRRSTILLTAREGLSRRPSPTAGGDDRSDLQVQRRA